MYAAVLGLTSCLGAWLAWRRHPEYSPTATFRVLGEILLLIIAILCIIVVTVNLIENRPLPVQIGALFAVIVLAALGMIFSITALTTPKSAHLTTDLPPRVPVVNLRRRSVTQGLKITGLFAALCAAVCLIPGATRFIAVTVLGMTILLASILLPTAYFMARRFDRAATALQLHPWLHWHYAPHEWQAWSATRVERLTAQPTTFKLKRDWRRVLPVVGAVLVGALILTPGSLSARIGWAAVCSALILGLVELAAWDARRAPQKLRTLLGRAAPDAYFGDDGLLCDDRLMTWLGADGYLTAAGPDERPPRSLLMQFEKLVPNPYGSPRRLKISQNVLIPADCAPESLSALRQALALRCPRATLSF